MNQFLESWADPHARHAMLVHTPIVLAMLGVPLVIAAAVLTGRSEGLARFLRTLALAAFIVASGGALVAAQAGHAAADALQSHHPPLLPAEESAIAIHRSRGSIAWIWPLIPAALLGLAQCGNRGRSSAPWCVLAVVASLGVATWYGVIAHAGGRLVYRHGLGVPVRQSIVGRQPPETIASPGLGAENRGRDVP
jgi:uncharacterized membrane protein